MILHVTSPESLPAMFDAADDASDFPVITVAPEVYDAILLARRVMVATQGSGKPDFFGPRRCLMTAAREPGLRMTDRTKLLDYMVGG